VRARHALQGAYSGWRRVKALGRPRGLTVAVFGADGSGKSTVIEGVLRHIWTLRRRRALYLHFGPRVGRSMGGPPVTQPHGRRPRGTVGSTLKLVYYLLDFAVGYSTKVWPARLRGTVVVFDRYYHDILVDPSRYRYGGPQRWPHAVARFIPMPDLVILLDAPPEVLQARKQEVTLSESARVRQEYLEMMAQLSGAHIVDAARSLDDVVADVTRLVIQRLDSI
jgi:thymidylate kinase